jgi:hypothetical protein
MITIFRDFHRFSDKNLAFFLKNDVMIHFSHNSAVFLSQKRRFFRRKYIFLIITSVPGSSLAGISNADFPVEALLLKFGLIAMGPPFLGLSPGVGSLKNVAALKNDPQNRSVFDARGNGAAAPAIRRLNFYLVDNVVHALFQNCSRPNHCSCNS